MEVHLRGFTVMRCCVDNAFRLDFARPERAVRGQEWASVTIEGPFEYVADGTTLLLEGALHPEELGPVLTLFLRTVEAASVAGDGTLRLQFDGQASLRISSLPEYEAWELTEGDGRRLICMPGGEIAIFEAFSERQGNPSEGGSSGPG